MLRLRSVYSLLVVVLIFIFLPSYQAQSIDANADNVAEGLQDLLPVLDALDTFEEISGTIPFAELSPQDALSLSNLFTDSLATPLNGTFNSLSELATAIDSADTTVNGVSIAFDNVALAANLGDHSLVDGRIDIQATQTLAIPISTAITETNTALVGGNMSLTFTLSTTLEFQLDTATIDTNPDQAFYLTNAPVIHIAVASNDAIDPFSAHLGIADVTVSGTALLNLKTEVGFQDPDGDGRITRDEWQSTAVTDLFTAGFIDAPGDDINVNLALAADNLAGGAFPGSPEATVTWQVADINAGVGSPTVTWSGGLDGFTNLSADELLTGIAQMATGLVSAQSIGDMPIPLIDTHLSDAVIFAEPLIDFVEQQGIADIVCGTEPGVDESPPRGDITNIKAGETVYCRAYTLEDATSVTWNVNLAAAITNATNTDTVGTSPTLDVSFVAPTDGKPDIDMAITLPNFGNHTLRLRFDTVQELFEQLRDLGGFDDLLPTDFNFDPDTYALTYRLHKNFASTSTNANINFGNQLEQSTGLTGLAASGSTDAEISTSDVAMDVTFGIVLAPEVPTAADRFFLRVRDDAPELQANVVATATIELTGQIGFVDVIVTGDPAENPGSSEAFVIGPANSAEPMLTLNINATDYAITGTSIVITEAIGMPLFLNDVGGYLTADCNLSMSAGLLTEAQVSGIASASGGMHIAWTDAFESATCIPNTDTLTATATADFTNQLQNLDLNPGLFGKHTSPVTDTLTLTDADGANFTGALVGVRLANKTDGSSCVITSVTPNSLTCESGLQGGQGNYWQQGDDYKVDGNPLALLNAILDNIEVVVTAIDDVTGSNIGGILDEELPILPVSPNDLISQFRNIENVLNEIRTGDMDTSISCGPINVEVIGGAFDMDGDGDIDGDDDGAINGVTIVNGLAQSSNTMVGIPIINGRVDLNNDGIANDDDDNAPAGNPFTISPGAKLYCRAVSTSGSIASVAWSVNDSPTVENSDLNTIGTNPTALAEFTINDTANYRIRLSFNDAGGAHGVSLPSLNPPTSLARLEQVIEEKLGIPADALTFELTDLPPAGSNMPDGVYDLVMRLGYGICTRDNETLDDCNNLGHVLIPRLTVPVSIDLEEAGIPSGLVGFETDATLSLEFLAEAQLDMGIALNTNLDVVVLNSTGIMAELAAGADDISFKANVGPLGLLAGETAVFTGTHTIPISSTTILTDTSGVDFVTIGITATDTIINLTDDASCEITAVTPTSIICSSSLSNSGRWNQNDTYQIGGNGDVKIGVGFAVSSTISSKTADITTFTDNLDARFSPKAVAGNCIGDVCAALSLAYAEDGVPQTYLGDLILEGNLDLIDNEFDLTLDGYDRLGDHISNITLDWLMLFKVLPELLGEVEQGLEGAASDVDVPLVGDTLDAGAEVASTLQNVTETIEAGLDALSQNMGDTPQDVETTLETYLTDTLTGIPDLEYGQIDVTVMCDPTPCGTTPVTSLATIEDVRIQFVISQTLVNASPNFDLGIPGVPLRSAGTLDADVTWSLLVDFGLSREHGPYLVAHDENSTNHKSDDNELKLIAEVGLGENDPNSDVQISCNSNDPLDDVPPDSNLGTGNYHTTRCMLGELAFLQVHLRDSETDPTRLGLDTGINILKDTPDTLAVIGLRDLVNGSVGIALSADIDANVNLRFRTGLNDVDGFPTILGTFELEWGHGFTIGTISGAEATSVPLEVGFDNLYLDAGSFLSQFLAPVTESVQDITSPLMPVVETVSSPLPVLSDLSRLVGGDDISLLSLMENASGSDLSMLKRLLEFVQFSNSINVSSNEAIWIGLGNGSLLAPGGFSLKPNEVLKGVPTSGKQRDLIDFNAPDFTVKTSSTLQSNIATKSSTPPGTFGVGGLTFPFIQEPSQIFGLLMGEDATLVRYDAGTMRATATVDYTFRFAVGPIPMSVSLLGSATIEGRFAMGYDTYGIRQVVNGDSPVELLNGIFIDDLDSNGNDVPEIMLKGTITARAAVDLVIVSAGVEGGIELSVNLNLDDRPDPDGKLRLDEIVNKLGNPICLFEVSGKLEAFFAAFVKIDFFFTSKTFRYELARVTLLNFEFACDPPQPKLAKIDNNNNLVLLMGSLSQRQERGIAVDKENEQFTVRMLENGRVSVTAFGEYQTFCCNFDRVIANADSGDDVVSIEAGADANGNPIPFNIPVTLNGGDGNDELRGGDGNDELRGGSGNDKLNGAGGNDTIRGENGDDAVDGGLGNDTLYGGDNNDRLNGGPGADHVEGGSGDDQLTGGPGTNEGKVSDDLGDTLIGNSGSDALSGGFGNDTLYGDDIATCADNTSMPSLNGDLLEGGPGADNLFGGSGKDELIGGGDDDQLCGNGDDDTLFGDGDDAVSDGADNASGGHGDDTIYGDGGNDTLNGNDGNDIIYGSDGNDAIHGGNGRDLLYGDTGNDTIYGDDGISVSSAAVGTIDCDSVGNGVGNADCLFGGDGADTMHGEGGHDFMYGDAGNDTMNGNAGNDFMRGGSDNDAMNGNADNDEMYGDSGGDTMHGNAGDDFMRGGIGTDTMFGDDQADTMYGDADNDTMRGGNGDDIMYGNAGDDDMEGNTDADTMAGGTGQDDMIGGSRVAGADDANDIMEGNDDHDVMLGDNGDIVRTGSTLANGVKERTVTLYDLANGNGYTAVAGRDTIDGNDGWDSLYGGGEADTLHGNDGDDYVEGNGAGDLIYGDTGQDDLIGGTSQSGVPDEADIMTGNEGHDTMTGDNATITRGNPEGIDSADGSVVRTVTLYDLIAGNNDTSIAGSDTMDGNDGNDNMYGGGEADTMHGNNGDDYIEGNGANDTIHGDADQDDLIGGTSQEGGNMPDSGDTIFGGADYDVILGDNGAITRDFGQWQINSFNNAVTRHIILFDVNTVTFTSPIYSSGGDILSGGGADDLMYGQGNGNDTDDDGDGLINEDPPDGIDNDNDGSVDEDDGGDFMHGDAGEDYMEGNAGADWLYGDAGNDDMVGGTGRINNDPAVGINGRYDGNDTMFGGFGYDVMAGDNALIVRTLVNDAWQSNTYNDGIQHEPRTLLDVDSPFPATSGTDTMYGNDDDDLMYGQGANDAMFGGNGDDFMEGNAADDTMSGDADQDDMIGGTVVAGLSDGDDVMLGNDAADVMLGDNGSIVRPLTSGSWQTDANTHDVVRNVVLFDVETTTNTPLNTNLNGDDEMEGNADNDIMFGQGGDDTLSGGAAYDYMEGNAGNDIMSGNGGEDDMVGGGSANDGIIDTDRIGDGLTDGTDTMFGGADGDVMSGDNARLLRMTVGGLWQIDPNTGGVIRDIQLFDVDTTDNNIDARTSGSDFMYGEDGRDFMFGQGNDASDNDGDGRSNEDPVDSVDNDRDGRESPQSVGYDCEDGRDNDNDGLIDEEELACTAAIDEDGGGDEMHGGDGDDYMEGNHGSDWMFGDADEDDMLGGSSAGDGHIFGDVPPTNLVDGDDIMHGNAEDDLMIGDNGGINRPTDSNGLWLRLNAYGYDIVVRITIMAHAPEDDAAAGHDYMTGDDGHDEMYGQVGNDYMKGNAGDDALVGDLGQIISNIEDGSREQLIAIPAPFIEDTIYVAGTLYRHTELFAFLRGDGAEGDDIMLGGAGLDSMHGGAGDDIMNGNADEDHLFGGDGDDALWGGPGHDHLWGGYHDDHLDVVPRGERQTGRGQGSIAPADPPEWFTYGRPDHYQDIDTIYGGWDQDALQADIGGPGPVPGDRLIDWAGGYNVFYVCPAAYGEGMITRQISPQMIAFLQQLAQAGGALETDTSDTSGFREVAIIFPQEVRFNTHPPHLDHPGHFTCVEE